ncbi:unnamed protein product [Parnassius mnemosyne]|uniref:Major facilitator superfamily (MFS) profile domain-containing protein n=1 Tax=Parnassius mnemosyne TaxID=213953 RepID=A0AAV1LN40_9NEOP
MPFYFQILILAAGCFHSFSAGIVLAYPSVLNAAILSPDATDIKATTGQASWIASAHGFSGLLGFFIFSPLFQVIGRKPVNISFEIFMIVGWILLYFSKSITMMIIAKSIQGLAMGGVFVYAITISEFTHRKRRGVFLTITKCSLACGSLLCHALAIICDFRQIALISLIPNGITLSLVLFCPESPAFYAIKGHFEDCKKSFFWLHSDSQENKAELKHLISAQMERRKSKLQQKKTPILYKLLKKLLRRDFGIPFLIATLCTVAVDASGRYFLLGYVTQIMTELVGDKDIAGYCSMVADCLLIVALFISSIVIRSFKRRTVLLGLGAISASLMFIVGLSVVVRTTLLLNTKWITPLLILLHSFTTHIGLIPAAFTVTTEIFPLNHKGMGSLTTGITFTLFYAVTMKITPLMIEKIGIGGTYLIFGLCVTICLVFLYFILPETKNKTLQEIEDGIKRVVRNEADLELILSNDPDKSIKVVF